MDYLLTRIASLKRRPGLAAALSEKYSDVFRNTYHVLDTGKLIRVTPLLIKRPRNVENSERDN